jgi:hypothetical protein
MALKVHHWIMLLIIFLMVVIISLIFKLCVQDIIQLVVANVTIILAIAAFESIRVSETQLVKSKSPILGLEGREVIKANGERDIFNLEFQNIGFGPAFNIEIDCERAGKSYKFHFPTPFESFNLGQGEKRGLSYIRDNSTADDLRSKHFIVKTRCVGALKNEITQKFEFSGLWDGVAPFTYHSLHRNITQIDLNFGV